MLDQLRDEGKAIWMTTHDVFRARVIADRLGIMVEGHLVKTLSRAEFQEADLERLYVEYVEQPVVPAA